MDLDVALTASDYLILAVPLTPATFHLIGRGSLKRMKPGALLINIGRGSVVDEGAVADALQAAALGGYAADVYEMEDWALPEPPARDRPAAAGAPVDAVHAASRIGGRSRAARDRDAGGRRHRRRARRPAAALSDQRAVIGACEPGELSR